MGTVTAVNAACQENLLACHLGCSCLKLRQPWPRPPRSLFFNLIYF